MKDKLLPIFLKLAFFLNLSLYVLGQEATTIDGGSELAKLLPDSDVVVVLKASKILNETLPQLLSADHQPLLAKITDEINKIKDDNKGLDFRDVENAVIGLKLKPVPVDFPDLDKLSFTWTALFRSRSEIDSRVPILMAKRRGKHYQEESENRTIYLARREKPVSKNKSKKSDSEAKKSKLKKPHFAASFYDENTLAMGSPEYVKKTLGESQKVDAGILNLLIHKPASVVAFGAHFPKGLSSYIDLEDIEELSAAIYSIRKVNGSLDMNEGNAFISLVVEASKTEHARFLHDLLITFRLLAVTRFGLKEPNAPKNAKFAALFRMINNVEVSQDEKKVMLSLKVKENDFGSILEQSIKEIFFSKEEEKSKAKSKEFGK